MTVATTELRVPVSSEGITNFCRKWQVRRLELFGSVLRDDFGPDSDVDVLVTFEPGVPTTAYKLLDMGDELSLLFDRRVDLISKEMLAESARADVRATVLGTAQVIYED
jgi:predicted nucleotidyltransferase